MSFRARPGGSDVTDTTSEPEEAEAGPRETVNLWRFRLSPTRLLELRQEILLLGFLVVLAGFFALTEPTFTSALNIQNLLRQTSVLAMLVIGQLFVILIAGLDISVGFQVSMVSLIAVTLSQDLSVPLAFALAVLAGSGIGLVNGVIIAYLRVSPIIATLAMWQVLFGLALLWTQGLPFRNASPEYAALGSGYVWFLAAPTLLALVAAALGWMTLNRTKLGRHIYAVGGNSDAARLSGVNVKRVTVAAYVLCSFFTAIGAITLSSRIQAGETLLGANLMLETIAAVFVGGTLMSGGSGTISGVLLGAILLRTLQNGFNLRGVSSDVQTIITGILIVASVAVYGFRRRARG